MAAPAGQLSLRRAAHVAARARARRLRRRRAARRARRPATAAAIRRWTRSATCRTSRSWRWSAGSGGGDTFVVRRVAGAGVALQRPPGPRRGRTPTPATCARGRFLRARARRASSCWRSTAAAPARASAIAPRRLRARVLPRRALVLRPALRDRGGPRRRPFPGYAHAACHVEGTPNPDAEFHSSAGRSGRRESGKGWHDAGDYGKYVVNSGITTGQLLWAYERYADRVGGVRLDIPESGDATPDLLDEARWNLEWMLSMQDDDGGAWHKLTSARFGGFVMPESDDGGPRSDRRHRTASRSRAPARPRTSPRSPPSPRASTGPSTPPSPQRSLEAARRAFAWAERHPGVAFGNCCGIVDRRIRGRPLRGRDALGRRRAVPHHGRGRVRRALPARIRAGRAGASPPPNTRRTGAT